ncbi:MAG TPA: GC-type dockerin domain-anchored protein [Phycisphaerales bacterium]|nr:GC-type dockerin domain-anchored protein [Phycisphaerales bacterium]
MRQRRGNQSVRSSIALSGIVYTAALMASLAGCASTGEYSGNEFIPMAVKPAGIEVERREGSDETGPPPHGYYRIVGAPVPESVRDQVRPRNNPLSWSPLGPRPISSEYWSGEANASGRVIGIAPHPTDANICYISAASGGVWKTTNGGTNWTPLTDELPTTNGGAICLEPTNPEVIYYGTGEWQQGSEGDGLYRSTDGGATWVQVATRAQTGAQISGVAVSPLNNAFLHVTSSNGYSRSIDGGMTWTKPLTPNCSALEVHPTNSNIVYVAAASGGIYKSTNGGSSFTKLTGGLPTTGFGRIVMDMSKTDPDTLYAAFINGGSMTGLYKTTNGGTNWTKITAAPNFCSPQCWYDAYVAVDPTNANVVYCGGVDPSYAVAGITKTTNGGTSWTEVSTTSGRIHPDHHVMAFGAGNMIWEGNDGGVWKSTNGGASWTNCNANLQVSQIYNLVQHPTSPERYMGGTQDNGTPERTGASFTWPQLQVGDGGYSVFDSSNTTRRYTTYVYLSITRWNGTSGADITGPWGSDSVNWIAPLVGDPNSTTTLLAGTNRIWRTTNATAGSPSWTALSTSTVGAGGTINVIAVAKGASNTIYSGSSTGKVYVTTNGTTWNARSTGLPTGQISDIIVSPTDPATAYVSFYNTSGGRIFKTTDLGVTWTNATGTLPSGVAAQAIAIDWEWPEAPGLYVGSGAGVYCSLDSGATWIKDGADLPNVNVQDLVIDTVRRTIAAGTYGRGAWKSPLPSPTCPADFDGSGFVDIEDYSAFVGAFELGDESADFDGSGFVDIEDFTAFVVAFEAGC